MKAMNMKTITASAASKEFGRYIDAVQREPVVITKQNRPVAVTLSMQDAEELFQYRVEAGIEKGLLDVKQGRASPFTPEYAERLKYRLKSKAK
jgi:prevent-host-death family protein